MLGNYNPNEDSSQRQPMEQLFQTFNDYLGLENTIRTRPWSPFYTGKLQEALIESTQEFLRVLEDEKRSRMGLQEAVQHSLVKPYEVM